MSAGVSSSPMICNTEYLVEESKSGLSSVTVALMTLSPWSSMTGTGAAVGIGVVFSGVGTAVGSGV